MSCSLAATRSFVDGSISTRAPSRAMRTSCSIVSEWPSRRMVSVIVVSRSRRCTLPQHRQECLCHTGSPVDDHFCKYGRVNVAQTLLSVLVRLGTPKQSNRLLILPV